MSTITKDKVEKGKSLLELPENFVVFDLETTGLNPKENEIIEIAALKVNNLRIVDRFNTLIKPNEEITEFITNLTGISNELVKDAPSIKKVIPKFITFVENNILMGHNVNFDIDFISSNLIKIEQEPLKNDFVDTLRLGRIMLKELYQHRLGDLAKFYDINTSGAHRAMKDVEMTYEVYKNLREDAIKKYGSAEGFKEAWQKKSYYIRACDIKTNKTEFDQSHIFYDKNIVLTGNLERFSRQDALQLLVDLGSHCSDFVNDKTNYLIIGSSSKKSYKQVKAEELLRKGIDIKILNEAQFYEIIEENVQNKITE